jgi:hypothetical protein
VLEEVSPELQEFEDHPVNEEHCDSPAKETKFITCLHSSKMEHFRIQYSPRDAWRN